MSMLILCDTAYLKKGHSRGIKLILCVAMLGIYANYMILLVVPRKLKNTFPTNVCLMIIKYYLLMPRKPIVILMLNKLKNLLLLRVHMKLLL